jgi:hypothetical protein
MTEQDKIIDYYKVGTAQHGQGPWPKPRFIPKRVKVTKHVQSDLAAFFFPGPHPMVDPGIYEVECNQYGAVSVKTPLGMLGLKLDEFDIVEMTENTRAEVEARMKGVAK